MEYTIEPIVDSPTDLSAQSTSVTSVEVAPPPPVEVPARTRFLWGLGGFSDGTIYGSSSSMVNAIYINALGLNPVLANLACAIPRFMDFVTDPIIGHLSDNTRSRWGRRRPWMFAGLLICAITVVMLWHPPRSGGKNDWAAFAFLAAMMTLLFSVGYAFFNIPHMAMGYEMTTGYSERTHLFKWRYYAAASAGFLTPWILPASLRLEGDKAQVFRGSHGVWYISIIAAALILLTGLPSVFFCKEKIAAHVGERKIRFSDAVRLTLKNRPFWLLVVSNFVTKFGMSVTGVFFFYIFVYHIAKGRQSAGAQCLAIFYNAINLSNFLAIGPIARLSDRLGKKPTLLVMLAMSAVAYASLWYTFTNSDGAFLHLHLPWIGSVLLHWPSLITALLIGVFTNTMPLIKNSMLADVCDLDEQTSGHRREAFYGAVFVTTDKIAMAVSLTFQGFLLLLSGFSSRSEVQSWATIRFWLLALVLTQPIGFVIGIVSIFFYPLTLDRVHQIRLELNARPRMQNEPISANAR